MWCRLIIVWIDGIGSQFHEACLSIKHNETTDHRAGQFGPLDQTLAGQALKLRGPFVARGQRIEKHWSRAAFSWKCVNIVPWMNAAPLHSRILRSVNSGWVEAAWVGLEAGGKTTDASSFCCGWTWLRLCSALRVSIRAFISFISRIMSAILLSILAILICMLSIVTLQLHGWLLGYGVASGYFDAERAETASVSTSNGVFGSEFDRTFWVGVENILYGAKLNSKLWG